MLGRSTFRQGHNSKSCAGLIRKVDLYTDERVKEVQDGSPDKVDCKPGCAYCCYRPALSLVPEILNIVEFVDETFDESARAALDERLRLYNEKAQEIEKTNSLGWIACPFLVDNLCSIYEVRPLSCRAVCSLDVEACRFAVEFPEDAVKVPILPGQPQICNGATEGVRRAAAEARLDSHMYDLGKSMAQLLKEPETASGALTGELKLPPLPGAIAPLLFQPTQNEAHGIARPDEIAQAISQATNEGAPFSIPAQPTAAQYWAMLRLPQVYSSSDEILEQRSRYDQLLDQLLDTKFDALEMFNGLESHSTFTLAYQGLSVRDTLSKHGKLLVDRIAKKVLPQFSEPVAKRKPGRLRVGYISHNLWSFNGTRWALGWLQNHGSDIERHAIQLGRDYDIVTAQFKTAADHFHHLLGSVQKIAEHIKGLDLDVLIYPDLGMTGKNYQFASLRLARVQCTAWGHPVTSGLPTIDYYLSSEYMEPPDADKEYTEKLVRLPRSGLYYKSRLFPKSSMTREDYGIGKGFLATMAQYLPKWTPERDDLLQKIYEGVRQPLVFIERPASPKFAARLDRLKIRYKMLQYLSDAEYNRLLEIADVSIDPPDWSGGNTTIVSIVSGTPVVTLPGQFMRGRHSLAFNRISGLDHLVAKDEEEFVSRIVDREWLQSSMAKLNADALFDDIEVVQELDRFLLSSVEH